MGSGMVTQIDFRRFSHELLNWWENNRREFAWRNTRDPYHILVSEILLHRTRAEQVVPAYREFIKRFPTIEHLSRAGRSDVQRILHSLGLHWRTELLYEMAGEIVRKRGGSIPSSTEELESLPGISHYIAAAVRSFAFGRSDVLLDTNTVRILGRVFGIKVTDNSRRSKHFRQLYESLIDTEHPREFNYAMIDLGALVCTPREPSCDICPVNNMCMYGINRLGLKQ